MKPAIARLLVIGAGLLLGYLTYAGVSSVAAFVGYLGFQATAARFEVDVPKRFTDVNFMNNAFARYSAVFGLALFGAICAIPTFPIAGSLGASLIAAFGGAALATSIIFAKPDILRREEKSQ